MYKRKISLVYIFILSLICFNISYPQYTPSEERGDSTYRLHSQLEDNEVRTTIFNFGLTGREGGQYPITEQTPYEWPKNTGEVYMAMTQLFVGGEVTDENNNTIHIVDVSDFRLSPQGKTWNFEPVPGYYNLNTGEIANSENPDSWPDFWPDRVDDPIDPGWPGSWDGYLGKNNFFQGQEYYYKISDDNYDRYEYFPDSTDLTRKGLGLLVKCRAIELNDPLYKDIVFYSYIIKNDGTKPINKMGLSLWTADFVGGNGDAFDDIMHYDLENGLVYFSDADGFAITFGDDPVGMIGIAFLQTPVAINDSVQLGITNINKVLAGSVDIHNDETMWNDFMIPGNFSDTNYVPGDYDTFISSSYFSIQPGESTELVAAVVFGNGTDYQDKVNDLYANFYLASSLFQSHFIVDVKNETSNDPYSFKLYQNYPNPFNPETRISFQIPEAGHVELKVYDMLGQEVVTLVNGYRKSGNYVVDFNASSAAGGLASGVYIYRLSTGKYSATKKLLLLK
jgi:hypothetical protein